jgi:hypothetical protein
MRAGPKNARKTKTKSKPPNKKKGINTKTLVAKPQPNRFRLAKCSQDYLHALTNPFTDLDNVCIPDQHELPSWKFRTLQRFYVTIGTQGLGYVLIGAITQSQDQPSAVYTNAGYLLATITADTTVTGVVPSVDAQFPYTTAQITANNRVNCRTVACGARLRYISDELSRGGQIVTYRSPTTVPWVNGSTTGAIFSQQTAVPYPNDRQWVGIAHQPSQPQDYDYDSGSHQIVVATGQNANMIIMIQGGVAGTTFECEIMRYHELIPVGNNAIPGISKSHVDEPGLSAIKDVLQTDNGNPGPSLYARLLKSVSSLTQDDVSGFVSNARTTLQFARAVM